MTTNSGLPADESCAPTLRVVVVADDPKFRTALGLLLAASPGFACAGQYASVEEARGCVRCRPPDVALIELDLAEQAGPGSFVELQVDCAAAPVLLLTLFEDEERLFRCLCAGASGYVLKKTPFPVLLRQVRQAASGGAEMSPELAARILRLLPTAAARSDSDRGLTRCELELLHLLARGHGYRAAADRLSVGVAEVRQRVRSIYAKVHRHSRSEAIVASGRRLTDER